MTGDGTVGELGEHALIAATTARAQPMPPHVLLGPGDDAAVVAVPDGAAVVTTDMVVEGRHFRRDWSSATDVGAKAAARSLADVAAMGGRTLAVVVALGAPPDLPAAWALGLGDALREECAAAGAAVAGGDVVRAESVVVAVTAVGTTDGRPPVRRDGARAGDVVAVCGRLGESAAGYAVLSRGFRAPRALVDAHRRPRPPYQEGPRAAALGATAMVDVSDGLVADLGHVASASAVQVRLASAALAVGDDLTGTARALAADPLRWVLAGGEDHALAACFPAGTEPPEPWRVVGEVAEGEGVLVDGQPYPDGGWDHYRA